MDKKAFRELVKKYLNGTATEAERRWLEDYDRELDNEPVAGLTDEQAQRLEEEISGRIKEKIGKKKDKLAIRFSNWPVYRMAAILMLGLGLGWFLLFKKQNIFDSSGKVAYQEIKVPNGKIRKLRLADGTTVILNAGSQLRYPDRFTGASRQVWLSGEGFFDVTHQDGKPFIVGTNQLQVEVLGTRFNVEAYPGNSASNVSVVEGKVAVQDLEKINKKVLLLPGDNANYLLGSQVLTKTNVTEAEIIGWQKGHLNFKNETFKTVAATLERRYNVHIQVDQAIENCRIYARLGDDSMENALQALAMLMQAKLSGTGTEFKFSGEKCP